MPEPGSWNSRTPLSLPLSGPSPPPSTSPLVCLGEALGEVGAGQTEAEAMVQLEELALHWRNVAGGTF